VRPAGPLLQYAVLDVFAAGRAPFAGNPLAVVLEADGLSTRQMQALAREFNLSETTFPLPPTAPGADYLLRIFTPAAELPFAGHPSIGSAWLMRESGRAEPIDGILRQECGAGVLPLRFQADGAIELTGGRPALGPPLPPGPLLAAVGLSSADLADEPPRVCGGGVEYAVLAVRPDAVARVSVDAAALRAAPGGASGVAVVSWSPSHRLAHLRMFAPDLGVIEDPATGSAVVALGVWLAASGLVPAHASTSFDVVQGAEIGRPSTLAGTVVTAAGAAVECRVAGTAVPVAAGEIAVPS
jgi:trans-2,3-dihydro-3-hydroxyanthranilate isomerase